MRVKICCRSLGLSIPVILTQVVNTNIGAWQIFLGNNTCYMAGVPAFQTEVLYGFFQFLRADVGDNTLN